VSRFHKEPFRAYGRQLAARVGLAAGVVATALSLRSTPLRCIADPQIHLRLRPAARRASRTRAPGAIHLGIVYAQRFLVDQKFPNRDDDKNGQSDAIPDHAGLADFLLFDHAILRYALRSTLLRFAEF
jgi:hypothetical protein